MALRMDEIRELVRLIDESNITEFEVHQDSTKVMIRKNHEVTIQTAEVPVASGRAVAEPVKQQVSEPTAQGTEEEDPLLHKIVSPMVGTFYRAPSPEADAFVEEGAQVEKDSVVCIIEAMKLMNEIEAEVKGKIVKVLVENGQLVEYGQPLFLVKTV